jgi:O-antigen ligase
MSLSNIWNLLKVIVKTFLKHLIFSNFILWFSDVLTWLTCIYIIWIIPLPSLPSRQNLFLLLVLWFCWRINIKDNKKSIAFLLLWDEVSYTGRLFVLFLCIHVLQSTLVRLYHTSSVLSSPLPIVGSASLRLLYSFLYNEHINHIQVFGFLRFLYPTCAWSPLSVWPMSNNITEFDLGSIISMGEHVIIWPSGPD